MAAADKVRYLKEMENYTPTAGSPVEKKKASSTKAVTSKPLKASEKSVEFVNSSDDD